MDKEFIIDFEATGTNNNRIQGLFEKKGVIEEVKELKYNCFKKKFT